jgi:uncharacterized protein (DUF433 family)
VQQILVFALEKASKRVNSSTMKTPSTVVEVDPEKLSGAPVFKGTRVPIQNLFDYIEHGSTLDEFLEGFPSVSREQALTLLEEMKEQVLACA